MPATPLNPPLSLVTFSVILDDVVLHDGSTHMGLLGGGGAQTCFGARLFADENTVGIASGVGENFDASWFTQSGVDVQGLRYNAALPTMRAWQIIDEVVGEDNRTDQRRTQVWRVPFSAVRTHLNRSLALLPPSYHHAQAFHLGIHPDHPDTDFIRSLHALPHEPLVSVEVFKSADATPAEAQLKTWLPLCGVFSANYEEALSLGAPSNAHDMVHWFVGLGAQVGMVRLGAAGSVLFDGVRTVHVPAIAAQPVLGAVGAGNAYCGAFVIEYLRSHDLESAGKAGARAAKLLIENVRVPLVTEPLRQQASDL